MKSKIFILAYVVFISIELITCKNSKDMHSSSPNPIIPVSYPVTDTDDVVENYHGSSLADPYRWMEDDTAAKVEDWVKKQNEVTSGYLSKIPYRKEIRKRYEELYNYTKMTSPYKVGDYYFYYKNDGLQNQAVIYIQKGHENNADVFIDPNTLSEKGTVAINLLGSSRDDKYITYARQNAGSDWQEIHIREVATNYELPEVIKFVKFSGATWDDNGFYYSRYPEPRPGMELSDANKFHSIFYHRLGTTQDKDIKVHENRNEPQMNHNAGVTEDGRYLILYASKGTSGFETSFREVNDMNGKFTVLFKGYDNESKVITNIGDQFLVSTNIKAPNIKIIQIDPTHPEEEYWKTLVPESKNLLSNVITGGKKLFLEYLENASSKVYQYDYDGSNKKEILLPGIGSAGGFGGKEKETSLFYQYTSFTDPGSIYEYQVNDGSSKLFFQPDMKFNPADFEQKQVWYKSKDGTQVPMFLVYKKGLKLDGTNPCYLYAYGGFNISLSPSFSASRLI
ncbi:MAG: S9 family peptidase, partial [Saprospiraceae bacterium]